MKICLIQVSVTELHQRRALHLTSLLLTGLIRKRLHQKNRENRNPRHGCRVSNNSGIVWESDNPKGLTCWAGHCSLNMSQHVSTCLNMSQPCSALHWATLLDGKWLSEASPELTAYPKCHLRSTTWYAQSHLMKELLQNNSLPRTSLLNHMLALTLSSNRHHSQQNQLQEMLNRNERKRRRFCCCFRGILRASWAAVWATSRPLNWACRSHPIWIENEASS